MLQSFVRLASSGVFGARPGAAVTTTQIIQTNHKESVCVERLVGPDAGVPPAGLGFFLVMIAGGVMMAGQRVTDQNRVTARFVQLPISFVDQLKARQRFTALQHEIFGVAEDLGADQAN